VNANVYVKQERVNPAGSVKDRIAWYMIKDAIERGILKPGSKDVTIIEPTSGNTGIGLASVGAALGIPVTIVMPDTMSIERRKIIAIYGAELILTPGSAGMKGAIAEAKRLFDENPGKYFLPLQFSNPANVRAHFETTAPEIDKVIGHDIDFIVAGVGTGGTITGLAKYFKQFSKTVKAIAVEPATSPVISQKLNGQDLKPGPHGIQGIGAGFIPEILDLSLLDGVLGIETSDAIEQARQLLKLDGISAGISGGANIAAVLELGRRGEIKPGATIVTVLPDGAEKYLSTALGA
jgi:cysteine synthase A